MTHEIELAPRGRRTRPMPELILRDRMRWLVQNQRFRQTGQFEDRPDHEFLCSGFPEWPIGFRGRPIVRVIGNQTYIEIELDKPNSEGRTVRLVDPEFFLVLQLHCIGGGRIALEPHGPNGNFYYMRLVIPGRRSDGTRRRTYLLRLVADTPPDHRTREAADHHFVGRESLRGLLPGAEGQVLQLKGVAEARADTIAWINVLAMRKSSRLPSDLTAQRVSEVLDAAYEQLRDIPLGQDLRAQ